MKNLCTKPLRLIENRVWRIYTGGRMMGRWRGRAEQDGHRPEDWVASLVTANNATHPGPADEGLSWIDGQALGLTESIRLRDLAEKFPHEMLGDAHARRFGSQTALLVKVLDAATRLAIQAHPTPEDAQKFFGSPFGKTEAWVVLGTRSQQEPACVRLGFRENMTRAQWRELFDRQDIAGMLEGMHRVEAHPGDVFLLEGGVPHAIGEGCFLIEIQEPTDYTFRVERTSPLGLPLRDEDCHQGAGFDAMFEMFRYDFLTLEETLARWKKQPRPLIRQSGGGVDILLDERDTPCFTLWRMEVRGCFTPPVDRRFQIAVVVEGEGEMEGGGETVPLRQGDCLFLPAALGETLWRSPRMTVLLCLPPESPV